MKKGIHPENYRLVAFKDMSNDVVFITHHPLMREHKGDHHSGWSGVSCGKGRNLKHIPSVLYRKDETRGYRRSRGQILSEIQEEIVRRLFHTEKEERLHSMQPLSVYGMSGISTRISLQVSLSLPGRVPSGTLYPGPLCRRGYCMYICGLLPISAGQP